MNRLKLFFITFVALLLISACDPIDQKDDDPSKNPDASDRVSEYAEVIVNPSLPTEFEIGLSAEDWTTYFSITDEDDGDVPVTDEMLSWDIPYDYNEIGNYTLTCTYTNSLGNTTSESVRIEVIDGETPQEGTIAEVEIIDNMLNTQFQVGNTEPTWEDYFTIYEQGIYIETTLSMLTFSPTLDMNTEGIYVLTLDYVDDLGVHHIREKSIIVSGESLYDDIEARTIYEILYQTYAFDTVRIDGLEVVAVCDQMLVGSLNGEFILVRNYGSLPNSLFSSLYPGDIVNVVGDIYMSNGFSLNLELSLLDLQIISQNNEPTARTAVSIELGEVFNIDYLEVLTSLKETVATYEAGNNQLGGLNLLNNINLDDNSDYLIEFLMVNYYEGSSPDIFVLSYEVYEEVEIPDEILEYNPNWDYDNGQILSLTIDVASTNGSNIIIGYINDYTAAEANVVIIDTTGTSYDWLVPSLVEGGRVSMNVEVVRTDNNTDGYGFVLKPVNEVYINAAEPIHFGKTYGVGSTRVTTASDYIDDLLYNIDFLGIMPIGDQGFVYEMTAAYDSSTNTIGGLLVSPLGTQLNTDGEYTIQFTVLKYYEDDPYAEIIILNPYYATPTTYPLINEIGCLRNLIVATNNGVDQITAIDEDGIISFTINVPNAMSAILTDLVEGDTFNIIGFISSDGYTDTSIDILAIQIEKTS